jgi:prepilin-type processing-associated H-X9-DG protein
MWSSDNQHSWRYDGILNKMNNMTSPSDTFLQDDGEQGLLNSQPVFRHPNFTFNMNFADGHVVDMKSTDLHMINLGYWVYVDDQRLFVTH